MGLKKSQIDYRDSLSRTFYGIDWPWNTLLRYILLLCESHCTGCTLSYSTSG
jgi:hypothetical protein